MRKELGLTHPNIFPTAGAAIAPKVEEFVHSIGLNMLAGYGLTESMATVSCNHLGKPYSIGSVGYPIDSIKVKISEEGEVLLKGPTITPGYYNREDQTKASFDEEGYFRTGDSGYMKGGELFLKERIKDLFKTSNGKYIAPQMIETTLLVDKYIDQIAVIADMRQFVSALIIPEYSLLEEYAREHGIAFGSREDLCADERIRKMMMERIDTLQLAPDRPPTDELAMTPPFFTASLSIASAAVVPGPPHWPTPIASMISATESPSAGVGARERSKMPLL